MTDSITQAKCINCKYRYICPKRETDCYFNPSNFSSISVVLGDDDVSDEDIDEEW